MAESEKNNNVIFDTGLGVPEILPIMALRNTVLFPQQVIPIYIGRERSLRLIEELPESKKRIVVVAQKEGSLENPEKEDLFEWGTIAQVLKIFNMPDGSKSAIVQGLERAKIQSFIQVDPYFKGAILKAQEIYQPGIEIDAMLANIRQLYQKLIKIASYLSEEQSSIFSSFQHPGRLIDRVIHLLNAPVTEKQEILEELEVRKRLEKATVIINREIQRIQLGDQIQSEVQDEISKTQREYFLREQLKAIRKELGEDEGTLELKELEEKINQSKMTDEARKIAEKELDRLKKIPAASPEYTVSRTYLDWLVDLPWGVYTTDNVDISDAQKILDEDHYGLEKVKDRILEYLAIRKLKQEQDPNASVKGPILCFVGPPGVGKTSMGKSIARAMGRKFVRISLGGVRDEAEIRGHRRTYIGALPGRILQSIRKSESSNPIFMLDEIDKVGADFRGDPSSALLEVLDPEQNSTFSDHYLEVTYDLSKTMFIATANMIDTILPALRDRMEMLEFSGYIEEEKLNIAKTFLIPKQVKEHGLTKLKIEFADKAIRFIINSYTREAGVRNLEREIANVCRKVAREVAANKRKKRFVIDEKAVENYLGPQRFFVDIAERLSKPGVAIGLAWTSVGGDILFIEATGMRGTGKLHLTGQLGDVMKESAEAALSYIRSNAIELGLDEEAFAKTDIHIHVPAGAIPKDGPSAGVTILVAMYSLLKKRKVKDNLAMTGEITLRGAVLPIGGVKEKVLAAHRAGLRRVILPEQNRKDLIEIPRQIKSEMRFDFAKEMSEILDMAVRK
ncbi:MAG: endopeptidase La [Candidatus Marinimicrobia bacterium]|jgi:ATP-dependent Lon protease|nr:endopeptidase La [Candidatus Neomarinimicrobiota bacterium]MCK9483141.1 endopeptidase La [Candidatus Neomarinimicrobiota bacterium]MCK9560508.1 endopeptidase La [Candidatus Neomarinimicrobiota bacterium]MDD5061922.1 endopeptidase La [Candidatus Neomarinimicrobiota bacterium]MDD5229973.1 endopeptidase La [Candidatus Neomarinimicrobiota bacterium]